MKKALHKKLLLSRETLHGLERAAAGYGIASDLEGACSVGGDSCAPSCPIGCSQSLCYPQKCPSFTC
jgi:hypothetical protein